MMRTYDKLVVFIRKQGRQPPHVIEFGDAFIHVSGVVVNPWWTIEGIDVLEVRGRGVQTPADKIQVAIATDANVLSAEGDEALDVELPPIVAQHPLDSSGLEHDDFAAFRPAEVIGQPIHKQVITTVSFQANDVLAFFNKFSRRKGFPQLVRRKPDGMRFVADFEPLPEIE